VITRASTCDDYDMGVIVFRFVRLIMAQAAHGSACAVLEQRANPVVADILRLSTRVINECERMRQFVRFSHLENGIWYARCNPSASVVPLVMGHFAARLNDQAFIIYDENHHLAGVYDGCTWHLVAGDAVHAPASTEHDVVMQEAWKRFYDTLSVDARYNPELRRHFLPVRLWHNITEMKPRMKTSSLPTR
jgi:probable DNA metabolism protein